MKLSVYFSKNLTLIVILAVLTGLFVAAANGMESKDFVITLLRGLSVGSLTFLFSWQQPMGWSPRILLSPCCVVFQLAH